VYRGHGIDYDESRAYFPGDELRFMNWRLTARTGEPHIKIFREERKPGTFIVIDRRMGMRFGTRRRLKVTQAVRAATLLAFNAHYRNEPLAGVLLNSAVEQGLKWVSETTGEAGIHHFIHTACTPCPPALSRPGKNVQEAASPEESLARLFKLLALTLNRGSRVVVISDFQDLDDSCRSALIELSMNHSLGAIQVIDPAEIRIPRCGKLLARSADGSINRYDSLNRKQARAFEQRATALLAFREDLLQSLAIPCQVLMADQERLDQVLEGQANG
jgi:uncharacterized protein (DUF58 family)